MMNRGKFEPSLIDRVIHIFIPDYIIKYLVAMRKTSYYKNGGGYFHRLKFVWYYRKYRLLGIKLGFSIGYDVFGYGLTIPHHGTIVVGNSNIIGNYSVLHTSTCISGNGKIIGNCLYCATGVKMTSQIKLGNNISVGANSLVNKDFESGNALIGGIPAKFIKEKREWYSGSDYEHRINQIEQKRKEYEL